MKKRDTIYILLIVLLAVFIVGCTKQQVPINNPGNNPAVNPSDNPSANVPAKITLASLYQYGSLKSYSYRINTNNNGQRSSSDMKYAISSGVWDGKDAWILESNTTTITADLITNMYIDKTTGQCLVVDTQMISSAGKTPLQGSCPSQGPNSASETNELTSLGTEDVDVPAGKFTADKYSSNGIIYWSVKNVPVPLKIQYTDGSQMMVLTAYT